MAEDFPGDYCPFGVDVVSLIDWFSVVQLLGKSRKLYSHACYASLRLASDNFGNRGYVARTVERKIAPDSRGLDRQCAQIRCTIL